MRIAKGIIYVIIGAIGFIYVYSGMSTVSSLEFITKAAFGIIFLEGIMLMISHGGGKNSGKV